MNKISKAAVSAVAITAATLGVLTTTSASAASPDQTAASDYHAVAPVRLVDTRATHQTIGAGATLTLQVGGTHGVPADATSVTINVTATGSTAGGFFTVYPDGTQRPTASSVNFAKGQTVANEITVQLGANGAVDVFNLAGTTDAVIDLAGYHTAAPAPGAGNILHNSHTTTVPAGSNGAVSFATCAAGPNGDAANGAAQGYVAVGGGFNIASRDPGVYVSQSKNDPEPQDAPGWQVVVNNTTATDQQVQVWVVCISAPTDDPTD